MENKTNGKSALRQKFDKVVAGGTAAFTFMAPAVGTGLKVATPIGGAALLIKCSDDKKENVKAPYSVDWHGITVWQEAGVSDTEFNEFLDELDEIWDNNLNTAQKTNLKNNIEEIFVDPAGTAISHNGKALSAGCDKKALNIYTYLNTNSLLAKAQQRNSTMWANKKAKQNRVAKLAGKLDTQKFVISQRVIDRQKQLEKNS
jgi:hypothetical protein